MCYIEAAILSVGTQIHYNIYTRDSDTNNKSDI